MSKKAQKDKDAEIIEAAMLTGKTIPGREKPEEFDFDSFEFKTIQDFDVYNAHVRKHN